MSVQRDPRSFRVLRGSVHNIVDDEVAGRILAGGRPEFPPDAVEVYRAGDVIPAGRLTVLGASRAEDRGVIEEIVDAVPPTPAAVALAAELGVDIASVVGTGKGGAVTVSDIRAAAADPIVVPAGEEETTGPFDAERTTMPTGGDA